MRGIAKLLFDGDGDESRLIGLLGEDEDWFRLADEARRSDRVADAMRGAPRGGRIRRPMSAPD
jgi:hypothetical protein